MMLRLITSFGDRKRKHRKNSEILRLLTSAKTNNGERNLRYIVISTRCPGSRMLMIIVLVKHG